MMKKLFTVPAIILLSAASVFAQGLGGKVGIGGKAGIGGGASSVSGTWLVNQDTGVSLALGSVLPCTSTTTTSCTVTSFIPTVANSALVVAIFTGNDVTISSVTGCGGTWNLIPGGKGHYFDSPLSQNADIAYNTTNTGGCASITINVSGAPGSGFYGNGIIVQVAEGVPPAGATASLDQANTQINSSCGGSCTLPPFNTTNSNALTGNDFVIAFGSPDFTLTNTDYGASIGGTYNGCGSTYIQDYTENCLALNVPAGNLTGTAEQCSTGTCPDTGHMDFTSIAFKATFTTSPTPTWSLTNAALYSSVAGAACSPSCTITVPSTAGGKGFIVWVLTNNTFVGAGAYISSGTIGSTGLTVPAGCQITSAVGSISCAYVTSDPSGQTSLSLTMNTGINPAFIGAYEISKGSSISLDNLGTTNNSGTAVTLMPGQALSLSGTDDFVFQAVVYTGGGNSCVQSVQYYIYPSAQISNNCSGLQYNGSGYYGDVAFNMNVASVPAFDWDLYAGSTSKSIVAALAFK